MLRRQDNVRPDGRIGTTEVHLSSLIDFCARQYFLAGDTVLEADKPTGAHKVMWAIGLAAEKHVVAGIVADRNRVGVYGRWQCACRTLHYQGAHNSRFGLCDRCGTEAKFYKQPVLRDPGFAIVGSPDVAFFVDGGKLLIIEVKSMNGDDFKELVEPLPDHTLQGLGYRRLAIKEGLDVHESVHVLYVNKAFKWGSCYKEYAVVDSPASNVLLDKWWKEAKSLKNARKSGKAPNRLRRCSAATTPRAKKCPLVGRCFSWRD